METEPDFCYLCVREHQRGQGGTVLPWWKLPGAVASLQCPWQWLLLFAVALGHRVTSHLSICANIAVQCTWSSLNSLQDIQ